MIPRFTEAPADISVTQGDDVTLPCRAEGSPRPDITWTFQGAPLSSVRMTAQADGSLFISNVRVSDAGLYECSASNSVRTISSSAQVRVLGDFKWLCINCFRSKITGFFYIEIRFLYVTLVSLSNLLIFL